MRKVVLVVVAVFEILCGLAGFVKILGWIAGVMSYGPVPALWFGIFPIASLVAGVMLLLGTKYGFGLSRIILLLQIPYVVVGGIPLLTVAETFNICVSAGWSGSGGWGPTILGINILGIVMLALLLWAGHRASEKSSLEDPPPPPHFSDV